MYPNTDTDDGMFHIHSLKTAEQAYSKRKKKEKRNDSCEKSNPI